VAYFSIKNTSKYYKFASILKIEYSIRSGKEIFTMSKKTKPNLTPYAVVGVIVVLLFMYYYSRMYKSDTTMKAPEKVTLLNEFSRPLQLPAPASEEEAAARQKFSFVVTSPKSGTTVNSSGILVTGKTAPGADVFVNEKDVKADSQGNFSVSYTLDEGENYLIVGANDEYGNFSEQELVVFFQN
jgi:hypothetical protein